MNNFEKHAREEFRAAGWMDENGDIKDEMQAMICANVLDLLNLFSKQGHSGSSGAYALSMFNRLVDFKCIAPLTGEDWEWHDTGHDTYQNRRCSSVFKDKKTGECYDIDGKVFWEWNQRPYDEDEKGYPGMKVYKSYYRGYGCNTPITFPYTPPKEPVYEYRYSDAEPPAPPQTEAGLL